MPGCGWIVPDAWVEEIVPVILTWQCNTAGIWNEMSWGSVDYVVRLKQVLEDHGFSHTKLVLPDGGMHMPDQHGNQYRVACRAVVACVPFAPEPSYYIILTYFFLVYTA